MKNKTSLAFRYFVAQSQDGPCVEMSAAEAEKVLLARVAGEPSQEALWDLARFYCQLHRVQEALWCLRKLHAAAAGAEEKSAVLLAMGQTLENAQDYAGAVGYYMRAYAMEPMDGRTWYLIHNNLGFSFNGLGQFEEAEAYCRQAITIDPQRAAAHTNLGVALQGQDRLREAVPCFVESIQADASSLRAYHLLEGVLAEHPDLAWEFEAQRDCCRRAVHYVKSRHHQAKAPVYRGWRKRVLLWFWRLEGLWKRSRGPGGHTLGEAEA